MLMFSNYLLFGKYLKDYVIVAHVYSDDRKSLDGVAYPLNGRYFNEKGEYCPPLSDKLDYWSYGVWQKFRVSLDMTFDVFVFPD